LNELESFVDVLEKKIGDILAWLPEDEEIRNKDALEESPRCELATTLFSMKSQTKRISRKISNIIDRVQL
jgi:hypothetical protein